MKNQLDKNTNELLYLSISNLNKQEGTQIINGYPLIKRQGGFLYFGVKDEYKKL
ncbi:MAG: hypothetical protein NTU90_04765 [Proteobacteria bacterium]|nr:hypothetical protein [Pseudomonadota bacterium]